MIKIENAEVYGWEAAIRGMRNPMNSWDRRDSYWGMLEDPSPINPSDEPFFFVGPNDHKLMMDLSKAGTEHVKYRRMIVVYLDVTAPLYWWKEADTYKIGTVSNSCSTMHKIAAKEFTLEDFSCEQLIDFFKETDASEYMDERGYDFTNHPVIGTAVGTNMLYLSPVGVMEKIIHMLNVCRKLYLETKDKRYWWQMIQLLPSSYNQRRTLMLNYETLANIYRQRKNHKLDEWRAFCRWIESLPYSEIITLKERSGHVSEEEKHQEQNDSVS